MPDTPHSGPTLPNEPDTPGRPDAGHSEPTTAARPNSTPLDVDELDPTPRKVRRLTAVPTLLVGVVFLVVLASVALLGTRRQPPAKVPNPADQPAQASSADLLRRRADRLESKKRQSPTGMLGPRRLPPRTAPKPEPPEAPRPVPVLVSAFHTNPPPVRTEAGDSPSVRSEAPARSSASSARRGVAPPPSPSPASSASPTPPGSTSGPTAPRHLQTEPVAGPATTAERFLTSAEALEATALHATRVAPASAFQLAASSRIPAILQTEINSDLPGHVRAVVRRDVYDSTTGTHLLIPRGAVLYGRYNHRVVWGERRVLLAWQRVLFPDGSSLDLEGMPSVDGLGAAGLRDLVNNHFVRLYANALLLSAVSAGYQISQDASGADDAFGRNASASEIASAAVAQELTRTSNLVLRRNADIKPTLRIRPGFLFAVEVSRDLAFRAPYAPMAAAGP